MNRTRSLFRNVTIGLGALFLLGAGLTYSLHGPRPLWIYLAVAGALLIASILFERSGYRPKIQRRGYWQMTGERFRDPSSGHMMEVRFNPVTGERDYVEIDAGN